MRLDRILGDKTAKALRDYLGLETVDDLMRHYPRRYVTRGELTDIAGLMEGEEVTILAEIEKVSARHIPGRKGGILEVTVTDGSNKLFLTFFNQVWREKELRVGRQGLFAGKVGMYKKKRQLSHPDYELIPDGSDVDSAIGDFAGRYLPVYPATAKMPSWKIAQCVGIALDHVGQVSDYLPATLLTSLGYPGLSEALIAVHKPLSEEDALLARERLTFDEALLLQLVLVLRRKELKSLSSVSRAVKSGGILSSFDAMLPFTLTGGQKSVSAEIEKDLALAHPMYRLLQGEVGSGKTVIALRAMLAVVDSGGQAALLAPTEVLAQQHYATFRKMLGALARAGEIDGDTSGTSVALLTGSVLGADRKAVLGSIASGAAGITIGTHALLGGAVEFKDLGLIVVDEQHRFGVEQRDGLRMKSLYPPHVLVMTATPIPRTVAMTVFGDLDVSTLRELPLGRVPITTHVVPVLSKPAFLTRAWDRVREEVGHGHQVYIVAPRISKKDSELDVLGLSADELKLIKKMAGASEKDGDDLLPMASVEELYPLLSDGVLAGLRVGVMHGRMSSYEKEETMKLFSSGAMDVLISTTVIEVGVDVANASMMVIMDADRFGVSQLHQLRGRVGRGSTAGLCILVTSAAEESAAMARLNAVASTVDGFELSRIDLEQRREGDVLGASQSGTRSHLRLLRVLRDEDLIIKARAVAEEIVGSDPDLRAHDLLKKEVDLLQREEAASFMEKG